MVVVMHDITNLKNWKTCVGSLLQMYLMSLKHLLHLLKASNTHRRCENDEESLDMFLNIILKESNRIESLVMDLLDLSHIEQQTEIETIYEFIRACLHNY